MREFTFFGTTFKKNFIVIEVCYVFYTPSTSHFGLATVQVLSGHIYVASGYSITHLG